MLTKQQIVAVLRGETVEHDGLTLAWRAVHPDLRSSHTYRWPLPGRWAMSDPGDREYTEGDPCPQFAGDGLCLARTWRGAASGDIPAITGLICGYLPEDILAKDVDKLRVRRAFVFEIVDIQRVIRHGHMAGAVMFWADLRYGNLRGADLRGTYLEYANLTGANLAHTDLRGARLTNACLLRANLENANLVDAHLKYADFRHTNLWHAIIQGAKKEAE